MALNTNGGTITYSVKVDASGAVVGIKNAESKMTAAASNAGKNSGKGLSKGWAIATGAIAGITSQIFSKVSSVISQNLSSAISRVDTLNNYTKVMSNLGVGSDAAKNSIDKLSDGLDGLPTTLDSAALAVQRLTSVNGDVGKSTDQFLALNNAILAGGAPAEAQATAIEQMMQAYSKGKPDMMEWRSIMTAMPAQMNQVAQAMGYGSADSLGEALRSGKVSMDDFLDTVTKLNEEGTGDFLSFSEQAQNATGGIQTQLTNLGTAISKVLADALNGEDMTKHLDQLVNKFNAIIPKLLTAVINAGAKIASAIPRVLIPVFQAIVESLPVVIESINQLIIGIAESLPTMIEIIIAQLPTIISSIVNALIILSQRLGEIVGAIVEVLTRPESIQAIIQGGIQLLLGLIQAIPTFLTSLAKALPQIIENIVKFLTDPNNIMMLVNAANQLFFALVLAVPQILGALLGAFGTLVGNLWNGITSMFGKFAGNFGSFITGIFKNAINGVLSFIENFINGPIDIINGFISTINNAFGSVGVNLGYIGRVSLPRLASGGIVESTVGGRVIVAGEGGEDEWVVPESKMASLIEQIQGRIDGGGDTFNINISGTFATSPEERRKVADQIVLAIDQNKKRRFTNA